eukprot:scaffold8699_cov86-Cyclotella_meneghiniana.AAC.1
MRIGKSETHQCKSSQKTVHQTNHKWPTPTMLRTTGFGRLSKRHNFRQEACFETTVLCLFKSEYLDDTSHQAVCDTHPLISHLSTMINKLKSFDFGSLREYNKNWATQTEIPKHKSITTLACLLHYDGRVSDVMRFASNNYTAEYRTIQERIKKLEGLVEPELLKRYYDVMTLGAPIEFTAETTRANAMLHLAHGNHPSIAKKIDQVKKTMNKEERNNF